VRRSVSVLALAGACLLLGGATPAQADTTTDQQQALLVAQVRAQLGSQLADALAAEQQLTQSLADNARQQEDTRGKIADAEGQIADLEDQIARSKQHEAELQRRIDTERAQMRMLARAMYVQPGSVLVMLGEAQSLSDLITRVSDLASAGARASKLKDQLASDLGDQRAERFKQQVARDKEVELRDQLKTSLAQLQDLQEKQEDAKRKLDVKIAQTRHELNVLASQDPTLALAITDEIQREEDAIIAGAMQAVWTQVQMWQQSNSVGSIPTSAGHSTKYRFIWPEPDAQISQGFGPTALWFEPAYGGFPHFHTGIDLAEPLGTPVLAADDGVVALVGSGMTGYGNYIVIAHAGGLDTLYGHLSAALVAPGQTVQQGQTIGLEGSTGNSTGPHLHFELRINQKPVDPSPYLPPGAPSPFKA
jgi:murein DD-endopeptidase MepM/ murein hydrolase activator NlpD